MRLILLMFLALLFSPAYPAFASEREFLYKIKGNYSTVEDITIKKSLIDGWAIFNQLSSYRMGHVNFRKVDGKTAAHVLIEMNYRHYDETKDQHPAEWQVSYGKHIVIFWRYFKNYNPVNQARIFAHELSHLYYGLDDQYISPYMNSVNIRPDCIMGQYFEKEKVIYCEICQPRVDAYFKNSNKVSRRK